MAKKAFYGVQKGRKTGVFTDWASCDAATKGHNGAVFKKFNTHEEAAAFAAATSGYARKRQPEPAPQAGPSSKRPRAGPKGEDATFKPPREGKTIIAYCDGSSLGNGKTGARAGWGIYFEDEQYHGLNEARRLPGPVQTNNRAELMALIRAIQLNPDKDAQLILWTDSQYAMNCVEEWISSWRRRGWKSSSGTGVLNKDLIRRLDVELRSAKLRPILRYVKGHAGIYGNEMVDKLAKHGAGLPEEYDNENLEPPPSDEEPVPMVTEKPSKSAPIEPPFKRATPVKKEEDVSVEAGLDIDPADFMTPEELEEIEKGL